MNGVNKMAGEAYHLLYRDVYGIKTRSLRLTNVYGPGMRIKRSSSPITPVMISDRRDGTDSEPVR